MQDKHVTKSNILSLFKKQNSKNKKKFDKLTVRTLHSTVKNQKLFAKIKNEGRMPTHATYT